MDFYEKKAEMAKQIKEQPEKILKKKKSKITINSNTVPIRKNEILITINVYTKKSLRASTGANKQKILAKFNQ